MLQPIPPRKPHDDQPSPNEGDKPRTSSSTPASVPQGGQAPTPDLLATATILAVPDADTPVNRDTEPQPTEQSIATIPEPTRLKFLQRVFRLWSSVRPGEEDAQIGKLFFRACIFSNVLVALGSAVWGGWAREALKLGAGADDLARYSLYTNIGAWGLFCLYYYPGMYRHQTQKVRQKNGEVTPLDHFKCVITSFTDFCVNFFAMDIPIHALAAAFQTALTWGGNFFLPRFLVDAVAPLAALLGADRVFQPLAGPTWRLSRFFADKVTVGMDWLFGTKSGKPPPST